MESAPSSPKSTSEAAAPSRRSTVGIAALLVAAGIALAALQHSLAFGPVVRQRLFPEYLAGDSQGIFHARVLMRQAILGLWELTGAGPVRINLGLQCLFAAAGLLAVWAFARRWLPTLGAGAAAILAGSWMVWGFALFRDPLSYPWDLPAFAFSAAGLAAIVWGRFGILVAIVAVGTLNKETTAWLVPAFFFWLMADREAWTNGRLWGRVAVLATVFLVAYQVPRLTALPVGERSALTMSFIETDPGAPFPGRTRLWQNFSVIVLLNPRTGLPWIHAALALHLVPLLLWSRLPADLRRLWRAAPFFYAPTLLAGNVWELRIFAEALPLVAVAVVCGITPSREGRVCRLQG